MSKISKILKNNQNAPKTTSITPKTFQMAKIPLNPQNTGNSLETSENDKNTPIKPKYTRFFRLRVYFGGLQVVLLIPDDFSSFC